MITNTLNDGRTVRSLLIGSSSHRSAVYHFAYRPEVIPPLIARCGDGGCHDHHLEVGHPCPP